MDLQDTYLMDWSISPSSGDWMLILAAVVALCLLCGKAVNGSRWMEEHRISAWGPVIFVRTKAGLGLLDDLARPKLFWRFLASVGVPLVVAGMLYFMAILLLTSYMVLKEPPLPSNYNAPRNILLIPGVNQYIPLVWGWIALLVTMVVHEFAHGILCRVEGVRVKSMGLAFLLFPIAAFVEPDEDELFGREEKGRRVAAQATRGGRIRILSAGVISNFLVAGLAMALFFGPVIGAISPLDRVVVADVMAGSFAETAGLVKGMTVQEVDGHQVVDLDSFYRELSSSSLLSIGDGGGDGEAEIALDGRSTKGIMVSGTFSEGAARRAGMPERLLITNLDGHTIASLDEFRSYMNATLAGQDLSIGTDHGTYHVTLDGREDGSGLIGVMISGEAVNMGGATFQIFPARSFLEILKAIPSAGIWGFNMLLGLPFSGIPGVTSDGFAGFSGEIAHFFEPTGWALPLGGKIFWIANLLLWVGWINLYAGLFNCLPAVPLDGGHISRDLIGGLMERIFAKERAESMTSTVVTFLAWLIFSSLLFVILAPYLAHGIPS